MYRRKEFERAEDEFSTALNFEITPALRRRCLGLAASGGRRRRRVRVRARVFGELASTRVSPFFPKAEARSLASACVAKLAGALAGGVC